MSYIAVVFGASTELGRYVTRELLRHNEIDMVHALADRDFREGLQLKSRYLAKLNLIVRPLEYVERSMRQAVPEVDLAFCCLGSSRAAYKTMGSVEFHKINLDLPLRFISLVYEKNALRLAVLGHANADSNSRSDFLRVKGEFQDTLLKLHTKFSKNSPGLSIFKVPLMLTDERDQNGLTGHKLSKGEIFQQRFAIKLRPGPDHAVHVRDVAKAMRADALMKAGSYDDEADIVRKYWEKKNKLVYFSGKQIVDLAVKTRKVEAEDRAVAREHKAVAFRMAQSGIRQYEDDGGGTRADSRGIRAVYEGEDADNPFLSASESGAHNIQDDGEDALGRDRPVLRRWKKNPEILSKGSIEQLGGQQLKMLTTSQQAKFYDNSAHLGRRFSGARRRMQHSQSEHDVTRALRLQHEREHQRLDVSHTFHPGQRAPAFHDPRRRKHPRDNVQEGGSHENYYENVSNRWSETLPLEGYPYSFDQRSGVRRSDSSVRRSDSSVRRSLSAPGQAQRRSSLRSSRSGQKNFASQLISSLRLKLTSRKTRNDGDRRRQPLQYEDERALGLIDI